MEPDASSPLWHWSHLVETLMSLTPAHQYPKPKRYIMVDILNVIGGMITFVCRKMQFINLQIFSKPAYTYIVHQETIFKFLCKPTYFLAHTKIITSRWTVKIRRIKPNLHRNGTTVTLCFKICIWLHDNPLLYHPFCGPISVYVDEQKECNHILSHNIVCVVDWCLFAIAVIK